MRVGLLIKRQQHEAPALARRICQHLLGQGITTAVAGDYPAAEWGARSIADHELARQIDILVVLGGDGTLLTGAQLVSDDGVPIFGINLGTLGFLTTSSPELALEVLDSAVAGRLPLERRMRLRVVIAPRGAAPVVRYACNDAVISQGALARLLEFDALLDGSPITAYRADGLIIATPTGSTAYNLAAGGPIVSPDVQAMIISPICPHTLTNRPLVVPAASRIQVRLGAAAGNVVLTVDGQWGADFGPEDTVEIHAANRPLLLYRSPDLSYFNVLRAKLHWGERTRSGS